MGAPNTLALALHEIARELFFVAALTAIGASFSLYLGHAQVPWAEAKIAAGEIQFADARVLDVIWIDARSIDEYEAGHYSGAIHIDESDWDKGLVALMDIWLEAPRPIVVYCGSKDCNSSRRLADRLRQSLPESEIYNLKGGLKEWAK